MKNRRAWKIAFLHQRRGEERRWFFSSMPMDPEASVLADVQLPPQTTSRFRLFGRSSKRQTGDRWGRNVRWLRRWWTDNEERSSFAYRTEKEWSHARREGWADDLRDDFTTDSRHFDIDGFLLFASLLVSYFFHEKESTRLVPMNASNDEWLERRRRKALA